MKLSVENLFLIIYLAVGVNRDFLMLLKMFDPKLVNYTKGLILERKSQLEDQEWLIDLTTSIVLKRLVE